MYPGINQMDSSNRVVVKEYFGSGYASYSPGSGIQRQEVRLFHLSLVRDTKTIVNRLKVKK